MLVCIRRVSLGVAALILITLAFSGCGSSNARVGFTPVSSSGRVLGKLFLGVPIPGVPVTVETLDGRVLARQNTDGSGNFIFDGSFPADFRLIARVGDELAFSREVRGFPNQGFSAITVPTTLVTALSTGRSATSVEEAEDQVRILLGLNSGDSLAKLDESVNNSFSHLAFFARAQESGGVKEYLAQLVAGGRVPGFPLVLRENILRADLSGLGSPLAGLLQAKQSDPRLVTSTRRLFSRGLPDSSAGGLGYLRVRSNPTASREVRGQFGEVAAVLGEIGEDILESVGEDVVDSIIDKVFGNIGGGNGNGGDDGPTKLELTWIALQLEAHIGIEMELTAISDELTALQNAISSLATELLNDIQAAELQDDLQAANVFQSDIEQRQTELLQALNNALDDGDYFNNQPSTLPTDVENVLNALAQAATVNALSMDINGLQGLLTGNTGQPGTTIPIEFPPIVVNLSSTGDAGAATPNLLLAQRDTLYNSLGVKNDSGSLRMANFPLRSAQILDTILGPLETYGQAQILGANLLAEAAHQSPDPDSDIKQAKAYADNVARSLRSTRAQFPDYPLNEGYLIDLQTGVQWCTTVQAPMDAVSMFDFADAYDDGDTTGWRTPSVRELQLLLLRAGWAAGDGNSYDFQNAVDGLQKLGFNTDQITNGTLGTNNWDYFGPPTGLNNGWSLVSTTLQFPLDADYTGDIPFPSPPDTQGKLPFLLCRTLGTTPAVDIDAIQVLGEASTSSNPGGWPRYFIGEPTDAELSSVGTFTAFGPANVPNLVVELTGFYTIFTGDADGFQIGSTDVSTDYSQSTQSTQVQSGLPPTYFQTDDGAGVTVSNYSGSFGKVISHINADEVTTIDFFTLGYDENTDTYPVRINRSVPFNLAGPPQITMGQLQIMPRNVTVDIPGTSGTDTETQQFLALGFFSDETFEDFTDQVTWTVIDTDTNGTPVGAAFSTQQPGLLELTNVPNASENLSITATINQTGNPEAVGDDSTLVEAIH